MSTIWYEGPADGNIWGRYGLDSHEWTGSLSDRVAAIISKNTSGKEAHVNALLRDSVQFYAYKSQDHPELEDDKQMRDAISTVAHSGVLINDENLLSLTAADDKYVIPFGAESLMYEYNKMHQPDYGSLYQQRQRESVQALYGDPTDDEIKQHYGLDPHEWTGSLADRVMAIVNKNEPGKETHVNALLRDSARLLVQNAQLYMNSDNSYRFDALIECGGEELRSAISDASWSGVLINDEAMDAIKLVEKGYMAYYGGESLTRSYEQMRKLNDARVHYREAAKEMRTAEPAAPAPVTPSFDRFAPPQGTRVTTVPPPSPIRAARSVQSVPPIPQPKQSPQKQFEHVSVASGKPARTGGPVRVGDVAKNWLASHGRDEKGQPLVSASALSTLQVPAQRSGSIQAALPGSGITVGRSTPRVPPTARRVNTPEPQAQTPSVDDGFEL